MTRKLKDGWTIYKEWIMYEYYDEAGIGSGWREHWVETNCSSCSDHVMMPLSELVASGPERCDGCAAYEARLR